MSAQHVLQCPGKLQKPWWWRWWWLDGIDAAREVKKERKEEGKITKIRQHIQQYLKLCNDVLQAQLHLVVAQIHLLVHKFPSACTDSPVCCIGRLVKKDTLKLCCKVSSTASRCAADCLTSHALHCMDWAVQDEGVPGHLIEGSCTGLLVPDRVSLAGVGMQLAPDISQLIQQ